MKRFVMAALAASMMLPAGVAGAADGCYTPSALEAEQGMRFLIDVMVASTACRDQTYGLFQQRNHETVLAYQKVLIAHFHGNAGYDRWDTALANDAALKEAGKSGPAACQEGADVLKRGDHVGRQGLPRLCGEPRDNGRGVRPLQEMRPLALSTFGSSPG